MDQAVISGKPAAISSTYDLLNGVLKEIIVVLKADCGSLFMANGSDKEIVLSSCYNSSPQYLSLKGLKRNTDDGILGKVFQIKEPVLVRDIEEDARFHFARNSYSHYHTKSFISLPVLVGSNFIGLINVADKESGEPFSEEDLKIAAGMVKCASLAIGYLRKCGLSPQKDDLPLAGRLSSAIVHEINNPLDGILRYTHILLNQMEENSAAKEYLSEIKKGLKRVHKITKALFKFSNQVETVDSLPKTIDISRVIDGVVESCLSDCKAKIRLEKKYNHHGYLLNDLGFEYVALNAVKNALEAMPAGGSLVVSTQIEDGLRVTFQDSACGISRENIRRVFEPFFTTKEKHEGRGLGLTICKAIVAHYGGKIELNSLPGKGSCLSIQIPSQHLHYA